MFILLYDTTSTHITYYETTHVIVRIKKASFCLPILIACVYVRFVYTANPSLVQNVILFASSANSPIRFIYCDPLLYPGFFGKRE